MALLPKLPGDFERPYFALFPPGHFIASLVQFTMMSAAERHGEFVADFHTYGARLGKAQVMRVGWLPPADKAGLGGDEPQVSAVSYPLWFA